MPAATLSSAARALVRCRGGRRRVHPTSFWLPLCLLFLLTLIATPSTSQMIITVDTEADETFEGTDFTTPDGTGTALREAIGIGGFFAIDIVFAPNVETIVLDAGLGPLSVTTSTTKVIGTGQAIDGANLTRLFEHSQSLLLSNLTLRNGNPGGVAGNTSAADDGGCLLVTGGITTLDNVLFDNCSGYNGGAIALKNNAFSVVLTDTAVLNSTATQAGGGIYLDTTEGFGGGLTLRRVEVSGNTASGGVGGGLAAESSSAGITIESSTIAGNMSDGEGGGLYLATDGTITDSTIASNQSSTAGGGIATELLIARGSDPPAIQNSVVADNTAPIGPDVFGELGSNDYNLIENLTGATISGTVTNNIVSVDPELGLLADNGGPTQTMLPSMTSALLDAGSCPSADSDQRLFGNVQTQQRTVDQPGITNAGGGDGCDIGALEVGGTWLLLVFEDGFESGDLTAWSGSVR